MKKYGLIFIAACLLVCLTPLVGMTVFPTTETTENKTMSAFPSLTTADNTLNTDFFEEFDDYFNEHFAFRNELVFADAYVQTRVFQVSNEDTVIYGTNGWLYYASSLDDYLGTAKLSDREIYNLAHNLSLVSRYVQERGSDFLLTIPPNKNTLYGKYMPYYDSFIVDDTHNIDLLTPLLSEAGVPYADLLELFRSEKEVLYLKRDSHWNNKGALLAYNCIMDTLGYDHADYAECAAIRAKVEDGDLNKMLYTFYGEKEMNYNYAIEQEYSYVNDADSVEDVWIETESKNGDGTLLMFRDSFANTLIPLIANQFGEAYFTKEAPYGLESLMDEYGPDTVVFEKAERNLSDFISMPPIISAPETELPGEAVVSESDTTVTMSSLEYDFNYYKISGEVDDEYISDTTDILIGINGSYYEAYHIGSNEYEAYIRKDALSAFPAEISVLTQNEDALQLVLTRIIGEGELEE